MTILDRILTIIPAKGTSRRVPNKNLADLGGKPLVLWTIEAALGVDAAPHYVVVSSDSRAILEMASSHRAHPLQRPASSHRPRRTAVHEP